MPSFCATANSLQTLPPYATLVALALPSLMQLAWFARSYTAWKRWKDALLGAVRSTRAWQQGKAMKVRISSLLRSWFKA